MTGETPPQSQHKPWAGPRTGEFVALMAALMASNALAIDAMLPALPAIGEALGVTEDNRRQLVISFYLFGFGVAQLIYGPLADRFGRKRLLIGSLVFYAIFATLAGLASSFPLLLAWRAMQGLAAAGTRVLVMAIIRDRYHGSGMARITSLVMIVFMIVPILAPAFGQGVLAISSWRHIFIGLGVYAAMLIAWSVLRLPETLPLERRRPLTGAHLGDAFLTIFTTRQAIGNILAMTLTMGALFGFIGSIQQIVFDVFGRPDLIAIAFAIIAGPMAITSYANSRLVGRHGPRRLLLLALRAFTLLALVHLAVSLTFGENIWVFCILLSITMACFGLAGANSGALSMEPLGHIAGTASAVQGLITTIGGALIGLAIGQQFNGTVIPFLAGFFLCGLASLAVARWANPDRRAQPAAA
jgi:DHA1 family bicyclomycin/chloramphenicol resistance-like MFS transporter